MFDVAKCRSVRGAGHVRHKQISCNYICYIIRFLDKFSPPYAYVSALLHISLIGVNIYLKYQTKEHKPLGSFFFCAKEGAYKIQ